MRETVTPTPSAPACWSAGLTTASPRQADTGTLGTTAASPGVTSPGSVRRGRGRAQAMGTVRQGGTTTCVAQTVWTDNTSH